MSIKRRMRFKTSPGFLRLLAFESDFRNRSFASVLSCPPMSGSRLIAEQ